MCSDQEHAKHKGSKRAAGTSSAVQAPSSAVPVATARWSSSKPTKTPLEGNDTKTNAEDETYRVTDYLCLLPKHSSSANKNHPI